MATGIYNSYFLDRNLGKIVVGTDVFKALLVSSSYTFSKDNHTTRANITNILSGTNWPADGVIVTASHALDLGIDRYTLTLGAISQANTTLSGIAQVIYYVSKGGSASGDPMIACCDFGQSYTTTAQPVNISATTIIDSNPS